MRNLHNNKKSKKFAEQLLQIGNGQLNSKNNQHDIIIPDNFGHHITSLDDLIQQVYPNFEQNYKNGSWLWERAILAPMNEQVNSTNSVLLSKIPCNSKTYFSIDNMIDTDQSVKYPIEFLNSIEHSGLPPHKLELKVGALIMILRNLEPPKLCNGTRLIITKLNINIIEARIVKGKFKNEIILIPKIPMISNDLGLEFKRTQFPIKLAFAITINKSQGQTLKVAGINLEKPCFAHGQFYVECSRVGDPENLFIYAPYKITKNFVYEIVLK